MSKELLTYQDLISKLPSADGANLDDAIRSSRAEYDAIIVLDDDPTGTQTVYDIPILTSWNSDTIKSELLKGTGLFYILTNSRSLVQEDAEKLALEIGRNVRSVSEELNKKCLMMSRSDSTLRGHYPAEVTALEEGLKMEQSIHFIIPAFFEGGRFTINDTHYVRNGDDMIPAAETPFAKDKVFGFTSSDLKDWVAEKWNGNISPDRVKTISIDEIRTLAVHQLVLKFDDLNSGDVCIINAGEYADLKKVALAILPLSKPAIYRTAASFVAAFAAQPHKPFLNAHDLNCADKGGGLFVVGSYVPVSTKQLSHLGENSDIQRIELNVEDLLEDNAKNASQISSEIDNLIRKGHNVVISTSRKLISSVSANADLAIGKKVSDYLCEIVKHLSERPKYILAKGGITSSDIATEGLGIERAIVQGQIIAGVPVWEVGEEGKFPGLPYIVFPGNVGSEASLTEVVEKLNAV